MNKDATSNSSNERSRSVRVLDDGTKVPIEQPLELPEPTDPDIAGAGDPDNLPLTVEDMRRMRPVPRVRRLRRHLGLSQEAFAERYRIPVQTIADWEGGRAVPDEAAEAYISVIWRYPDLVAEVFDG